VFLWKNYFIFHKYRVGQNKCRTKKFPLFAKNARGGKGFSCDIFVGPPCICIYEHPENIQFISANFNFYETHGQEHVSYSVMGQSKKIQRIKIESFEIYYNCCTSLNSYDSKRPNEHKHITFGLDTEKNYRNYRDFWINLLWKQKKTCVLQIFGKRKIFCFLL
jgi:hypothetical protein